MDGITTGVNTMKALTCKVTDTKRNTSSVIEVPTNKLARDIKLAAHASNKLAGYKRYTVTINF